MKKFAANYVLSGSGNLLKNGILTASDDGKVIEIIDTKGDLAEIAQLVFLNGILIPDNFYIRKSLEKPINSPEGKLPQLVSLKFSGLQQLSIREVIEVAKEIQVQFPELKIPEILTAINSFLNYYFTKEEKAGAFLLTGSDLIGLHFKPQSRLKRIV